MARNSSKPDASPADLGCDVARRCVDCPLPLCSKERHERQMAFYARVASLCAKGWAVWMIAEDTGRSDGAVYRALGRFRRGELDPKDFPTLDLADAKEPRDFFRPYRPPQLLAPGSGRA